MNGFGVTDEELELARRIATEVAAKYGVYDQEQWNEFKSKGIHNDDHAVQTAIAVIKHFNTKGQTK